MPNSKHVAICSEILANLPSQEAQVIIRYYLEGQSEDQIETATGYASAQQLEIRQRARTAFLTRIRGGSLKPSF
jgi:DNA-directed RNA polymerase specialized sigma24 family protein